MVPWAQKEKAGSFMSADGLRRDILFPQMFYQFSSGGLEAPQLELQVGCFPLSSDHGKAWLNWDSNRTEEASVPVGKRGVVSAAWGCVTSK